MGVDDITKWVEGVATKLEGVYDPLDDVLRMRFALRTAVEAMDEAARDSDCGRTVGFLCAKMDTIRETLGIVSQPYSGEEATDGQA